MSYSYLKAVFPKFENSRIYDDRIYASLDGSRPKKIPPVTIVTAKENKKEYQELEDKTIRLENFVNEREVKEGESHEMYLQHILKCESCLGIVSKQLNIENDRIMKEELIELVAFIAFGIFMLMLIDKTKK